MKIYARKQTMDYNFCSYQPVSTDIFVTCNIVSNTTFNLITCKKYIICEDNQRNKQWIPPFVPINLYQLSTKVVFIKYQS